jgi:hypothetical protein
MELETLVKEDSETRENLKFLETEVKDNPEDVGKVKELQKKLKEAEAELESANAKSGAVEAKVQKLQDDIMNAGGEKLHLGGEQGQGYDQVGAQGHRKGRGCSQGC